MRDINQFSGDNLGGNIRFEFAEINDIDSIAESIDGNITEKVILKDGKQWYCGYATQQSIGYTETTEDSAAGILYKRSLVAFCPKDNSDNKDLFYEKRNKIVKFGVVQNFVDFGDASANCLQNFDVILQAVFDYFCEV